MTAEELIKAAWEDGRSGAHDTKRDYQNIQDYKDFLENYEEEIKSLTPPDAVEEVDPKKCAHEHIDLQDGCAICLECGVRNY